MSAEAERARVLLANAQSQLDREAVIVATLEGILTMVGQLNTEMAELRDELVTHETRHRRDVNALRESIRATDRVLNDRTVHLA